MIEQFEKLTSEERILLLKAPVLVSVLASCSFNEVNESQKADAIKLAHIKTFTSTPRLVPYYEEVEKDFERQFEAIAKDYFPFDEPKRKALKETISTINKVLDKLDKDYARELHQSLKTYAAHVEKAAHSVFQDFIFPMPIPGLSV